VAISAHQRITALHAVRLTTMRDIGDSDLNHTK
jgi:hypothetical protein